MTRTVYLVACTKAKREGLQEARDLYMASDWFVKARAYVESHLERGDEWFILSARHGLLKPRALIEPYNDSLLKMRPHFRQEWARKVYHELPADVGLGRCQVVFLAGAAYREHLGLWLGDRAGAPMARLGLGEQKAWLKNNTRNRGNTNARSLHQ